MKRNKTQMLLRWPRRLMRITGQVLLFTYLVSVVDPVMANVRRAEQLAAQRAAMEQSATEKLAGQLITLEETLERLQRRLDGRFEFEWQEISARRSRATPPAAARRAELAVLEAQLATVDAAVGTLVPLSRNELHTLAEASARSGLPIEGVQRQAAERMSFEEGVARLGLELSALRHARDEATFRAAVKSAGEWLSHHSSRLRRPRLDPEKLSFGSRGEQVRAPATDRTALRNGFAGTLAAGSIAALAAADNKLAAAPTLADLAPTEDVQITPAIRAKAEELGGSPVALFNFVHDNVRFVPSYGSIQGSDYTLQSQHGNAFDQASLLIALLRAANIPARYAYGVVEVPIDKAMNWVGGVSAPGAALSLLGQGGIPAVGLAEAGVIKSVRLEHVWVEVWANQFPGGGVRGGPGDNWVALDPSFKQYQFDAGMDIQANVPLDMQAITDHLAANSTSNAAEGWVQGVDQNYFIAQMDDFRQRMKTYVASQNPAASVGDIVGTQSIVPSRLRSLPGGLPYTLLLAADPVSSLPSHLRWKFRYSLGQASFFGGDLENEVVMMERSLPSLAGKSLALAFHPATPADDAAYGSYLPANMDGPEDIPLRLPANIVGLNAQFSVDGAVVGTSARLGLGTELLTRKGFFAPGKGWDETDNPLTAGDYQSIGLDMHGLSRQHIQRHEDALRATKTRLETQQFDAVKGSDVVGGTLQTALMTYFGLTLAQGTAAARMSQMVNYRLPSYGTVSVESEPVYLFGTPRLLQRKGVLMDMDRIAGSSAAKNGDPRQRAEFERNQGNLASGFEHDVFEKMFSTAQEPSEAISAVKALAMANAQSQRVYTITPSNLDIALSSIDAPADTKRDMADAVLAGKIVTTHASAVDYGGNAMLGYIVLDQSTGAGGYMIRGADGSYALGYGAGLLVGALLAFLGIGLAAGAAAITIAATLIAAIFLLLLLVILMAYIYAEFYSGEPECFWGGFSMGLGLGSGAVVGPVGVALAMLLSALLGFFVPSSAATQCLFNDGSRRPLRA